MSQPRGWKFDAANGRLAAQYDGTEVFDFDANDMAITAATTITGLVTGTAGFRSLASNVYLGNPGLEVCDRPARIWKQQFVLCFDHDEMDAIAFVVWMKRVVRNHVSVL